MVKQTVSLTTASFYSKMRDIKSVEASQAGTGRSTFGAPAPSSQAGVPRRWAASEGIGRLDPNDYGGLSSLPHRHSASEPIMSLVIAIDGPAAAGKGTLARRLGQALHLAYLDTGALYRAVGLMIVRAGGNPADEEAAAAAARQLDVDNLSDPALRSEEAGATASKVAAFDAVRVALLDFQRRFAQEPPAGLRGAVLDGRDVGSVVCPDAPVKIFVTASVDERARRRHAELQERGEDVMLPVVLSEIQERDERDQNRAVAPLLPADDAVILDTSALDVETAFKAALDIVARRAPDGEHLVRGIR